MAKVEKVEKQIRDLEGFKVHILHLSGRDVRGNRMGLPLYPYQYPALDDITVESWKDTRFQQAYPGFGVDVLDHKGHSVHGNTKLRTVRNTYCEDARSRELITSHVYN